MKFYEIDEASTDTKGFAWASGYGPLPEGMPFLVPAALKRMEAYWQVNPEQPGLEIDPGGRKWPDLLGNGHSPPTFFCSERVIRSLTQINVPIARVIEMPIGKINAKGLRDKVPPRYFVVEAYPGIAVAWDEMNVPMDGYGNPILKPYPKPWPPPSWKVRASSWSGADLVTWKNFKSGQATDLICTERIKAVAETEGWTNVRFRPLVVV